LICKLYTIGHGMEPLIFWTAEWWKGQDGW
jgi:hypothetical protein